MRHRAFTLENVHFHFGLVVGDGGEDAALLRRDVGVPFDERRERAILGLDTERVRRDVQQNEVGDLSGKDAGLDRGADRDHFVRVDAAVRLPAEDLLDRLENLRRSCLTADRDDVVEVGRGDPSVFECVFTRLARSLEKRLDHLLELGPGEHGVEMFGTALVRGDERQDDLGLGLAGKLAFCFLRGLS